ncbi:MAG: tyrosine--tRNA ligase [Filimonas sp.]|nr:tyrosine--tRNA ligase [Filimonas sp.]
MNLIEELRWRGMLQDIMPGTEEQLQKEMTSAYIGFDPTADSLHIGSLVPILLLVHLQKAGHKPYALVGGATGMIGDPSMKSEERNLLNEEQLAQNVDGIKKQLSRYLDFDSNEPNAAVMVNNYDWFKNISFIDFLRDTGKHITVNYMMAKDSVKKRIEGESGISYTEFAYQLMQGYDFYWLHVHHNLKLQMGGSDQWGNITTGTELIRRKAGGEAFAFTCPLIKKTDGTKFGKTEKGNVWLDLGKTNAYEFYQFWLKATDEDAKQWIKIFTFIDKDEIEALINQHNTDASQWVLQKRLAKEVTTFVHGEEAYNIAIEATKVAFEKKDVPAESLTEEDFQKMEGLVTRSFTKEKRETVDIITFLTESTIFPSKGEARKMIQGGGVSINRNKITEGNAPLTSVNLLLDKYLLIQKGKNNFYLVTFE